MSSMYCYNSFTSFMFWQCFKNNFKIIIVFGTCFAIIFCRKKNQIGFFELKSFLFCCYLETNNFAINNVIKKNNIIKFFYKYYYTHSHFVILCYVTQFYVKFLQLKHKTAKLFLELLHNRDIVFGLFMQYKDE